MKKITPFIICCIMFISLNILVLTTIIYKSSLRKNFFRLHITANSNHIEDQIVKIKLNSYLEENIFKNLKFNNKKDFITYIKNNNVNILNKINLFLKENNKEYTATMKLGKCYYDKKESKTYNMPEGTYDSLNIVLGLGYGKNMWTILYEENEELTNSFLPLSTSYDENVEYSFYTIELLNKIAAKFN